MSTIEDADNVYLQVYISVVISPVIGAPLLNLVYMLPEPYLDTSADFLCVSTGTSREYIVHTAYSK